FILCNTDNDNEKEMTYLYALSQKSIDGIILVSNTMTSDQLNKVKLPIISLDRKTNADSISITVNNQEGTTQAVRSEEHTSELQSRFDLVCRLLLEKKKHKK